MRKIFIGIISLAALMAVAGNMDGDKIKSFMEDGAKRGIDSVITVLKKMQPQASKKVIRYDRSDLSPSEANVLVGRYANVYYTFGSSSYNDKLTFNEYTDGKIVGYVNSTKFMVCASTRDMPDGITHSYTYMCMAKTSPSSSYMDFYLFNVNDDLISGYYDFGTINSVGYDIVLQRLTPMWGALSQSGSTSSSSSHDQAYPDISSSSSSQASRCLPGQPCGDGPAITHSSSSSCNITLGTLEDYENNTSVSSGTIAFPRDVVDQIVEQEKEKCKQDPKSCGINAIPIITTKSDTKAILDQLNGIPKQISGYYVNYGQEAYDWIYIPASLSSAYKLEKGVDENYRLRWTPFPSNTKINKSGNTITLSK